MPLWITLVVVAQLINAGVSLIDRYIVTSGKVGSPLRVAFYISVLSSLSVLVFLVGLVPVSIGGVSVPSFAHVSIPTAEVLMLSLLSAVLFIGGLITLFESFRIAQASDVVPVVSSVSAVATLLLSFYVLDTRLTDTFLWGFLFLVVGTFLVAKFRLTKRLVWLTVVSGVLFAAQVVVLKVLFIETAFDNAFFWSRIVTAVVACGLLLLPAGGGGGARG
jgi:drug/metabolite transporter (DMT)-like permease